MTGDISLILGELVSVQDQLMALPNNSDDEKLELLTRQDALRTRAARLADECDEHCSTEDLLAHLAALRRQHHAFERQRVSAAGRSRPYRSADYGAPGSGVTMGPNGKSRDLQALPRIEARIRRISLILGDRGINLR